MAAEAVSTMTNEELAAAIQAGSTDLYPVLWESVKRFIYRQAWRYYNSRVDLCASAGVTLDDLEQEGYLALVDAVAAYDGRFGLLAYIHFPLLNRYNKLAGLCNGRKRPIPLDRATSLEDVLPGTDDLTLADTLPDPAAEAAFLEEENRQWFAGLHDDLEAALDTLTAPIAEAVRREHYDGMTIAEAAELAGTYPETVRQRRQKGLRRLRDPAAMRYLEKYRADIIDRYAYNGSLASFKNTGASSTERAALKLIDLEPARRPAEEAMQESRERMRRDCLLLMQDGVELPPTLSAPIE